MGSQKHTIAQPAPLSLSPPLGVANNHHHHRCERIMYHAAPYENPYVYCILPGPFNNARLWASSMWRLRTASANTSPSLPFARAQPAGFVAAREGTRKPAHSSRFD
jgi:hypothetical protein